MDPRLPPRPNGSSAAAGRRSQKKIVVEPTPAKQLIYNRIWDEVVRQQHSHQQWLRLPTHRSAPISRASSSGGTSPTAPRETSLDPGDPPRRQRGRRGGPLDTNTRFKTALRRALKLVCNDCRTRKVACDCYDISRLEEACIASHGSSSSASALRPHSRASSRVRSSPLEPDLFGLVTNEPAPYTPISSSIADSDWGEPTSLAQPPNARPHVQLYASQFNAHTLVPGALPTPAKLMAYNPVLGNSVEDGMALLGAGFPVGSEIAEDAGRWRCEFVANSERCSWTGLVDELSQHWKASHHPIRQTEQWCECIRCLRLLVGWDKPYLCLDEACSPTGAVWKRWLYGHTLVESTIASTPALTHSGESENGSHDPGPSRNLMPPGGQEGSFPPSNAFGNGSSFGHQHCGRYQKESQSAEDGGELSGHAHEHLAGRPGGLSASKSRPKSPASKGRPPPISKDTGHAAHAPRPPRVSSGFLGCDASHPPLSWAKKMPRIFCTLAASGVATVIFEPRCLLGANIYVADALSMVLTIPWISCFLVCCSFVVTWFVQTWWSAVFCCPQGLRMRNGVLRAGPVSQTDSDPRHLRPHRQTRQSPGGFGTAAAAG